METVALWTLYMLSPVGVYVVVYTASRAWWNGYYVAFDNFTRRAGRPPGAKRHG